MKTFTAKMAATMALVILFASPGGAREGVFEQTVKQHFDGESPDLPEMAARCGGLFQLLADLSRDDQKMRLQFTMALLPLRALLLQNHLMTVVDPTDVGADIDASLDGNEQTYRSILSGRMKKTKQDDPTDHGDVIDADIAECSRLSEFLPS